MDRKTEDENMSRKTEVQHIHYKTAVQMADRKTEVQKTDRILFTHKLLFGPTCVKAHACRPKRLKSNV